MAKEKEKLFMKAMKKKFKEDPTDEHTTYYSFGGWKQSKRKREWVEQSAKIAKARGLAMYNLTSCPTRTSMLRQTTCTSSTTQLCNKHGTTSGGQSYPVSTPLTL